MSSPSTHSRSRAAAAALGLSLVAAWPARADTLDPSLPCTVSVGAPRGAAPSERLDPRRTGRARTLLPAAPVELWRRHVSGNVEVPPAIDEAGNIYVALTVSELIKVGPDSRERWRARFGRAGAVTAPALLSDGTITVITSTGTAWGFTPNGSVRFSTPLGISRRDADTIPVALANGGLLIAAGSAVVEIDADGAVRARGTLGADVYSESAARTSSDRGPNARPFATERAVGAVVDSPGGALVTTASGNVYRFHPPAAPRRVGSFGGVAVRGAMLADDRTLVAVVDHRRVVALDLPTGTTHVRSSGLLYDAPPALGPGGLVVVGTQLGLLLGIDAAGNEKIRAPLDRHAAQPAGGAPVFGHGAFGSILSPSKIRPSPPVVVDPAGRIAFLRADGRAGVVTPEGKVQIAAERVCGRPISLAPAGEKRMVVACHDGGLWMYGE
jgi:hypothetical protein